MTYADLAVWYVLCDNYHSQGIINLDKYPLLKAFKQRIESNQKIADYIKNPNRFPVQPIFVSWKLLHTCYFELSMEWHPVFLFVFDLLLVLLVLTMSSSVCTVVFDGQTTSQHVDGRESVKVTQSRKKKEKKTWVCEMVPVSDMWTLNTKLWNLQSEAELEECFKLLDSKKQGFIEKEQLGTLLRVCGATSTLKTFF